MTDQIPYELSLLQFNPYPAGDERVNIGVVAFSPTTGKFVYRFNERYGRLKNLFPGLDGGNYRSLVRVLAARARAVARSGPKGDQLALATPLGIEEVLGQIIAPNAGNFAWSGVRFGVCTSLASQLDAAFEEFIGQREAKPTRQRRDDEAVWRGLTSAHPFEAVSDALRTDVEVATADYRYVFRAGWNNGRLHVVEPISLDYIDPGDMVEEAARWRGRLDELAVGNDFKMTAILSDPPRDGARRQYDQANHILERDPRIRAIFKESQVNEFVRLVQSDLAAPEH